MDPRDSAKWKQAPFKRWGPQRHQPFVPPWWLLVLTGAALGWALGVLSCRG